MPSDIFDASGKKVGTTPNPTSTPTSTQSAGVHASDAWEQSQRQKTEADQEQAAQDKQQLVLRDQLYREGGALFGKLFKPLPVIIITSAVGLFLGWARTKRCQ